MGLSSFLPLSHLHLRFLFPPCLTRLWPPKSRVSIQDTWWHKKEWFLVLCGLDGIRWVTLTSPTFVGDFSFLTKEKDFSKNKLDFIPTNYEEVLHDIILNFFLTQKNFRANSTPQIVKPSSDFIFDTSSKVIKIIKIYYFSYLLIKLIFISTVYCVYINIKY